MVWIRKGMASRSASGDSPTSIFCKLSSKPRTSCGTMATPSSPKPSQWILTSPFFESGVIRKFLDTTLSDDAFPKAQLERLLQCDAVDTMVQELVCSGQSPLEMTKDNYESLKHGIDAISVQLALDSKHSRQDSDEACGHLLLSGYCRLLAGQYLQASSELDVVRQRAWKNGKKSASSTLSRSLMVMSLTGLEIAARIQQRQTDADRYQKWRLNAVAH